MRRPARGSARRRGCLSDTAGAANLEGMMRSTLIPVCLMALICGCADQPKSEVTVIDYRNTQGAYVLVYSGDEEFRAMFEDQLVSDLAARDMAAFASHNDLPDVTATSRNKLLGAANDRKAMFVLVVEEVKEGEKAVTRSNNPGRISHEHPTLQDFYSDTRPAEGDHQPGSQVFVEVSGFLIQGNYAKLVWSGTTWSLEADDPQTRISELSTTIANAIEDARRKRRLGFE